MQQVTIKNNFISLGVLDYGAIVQKILFRDKNGKELNLVVGFENPEDYLEDQKVLGACVGRFAGRISNGGFRINDTSYNLFTVDGVHLHGGKNGFSKKYWTLDKVVHEEQPMVKLNYKSPHHSYFCLDKTNSIDHYELQLECPEILETYNNLLPTGNLVSVTDTEYDFLNRKKIAQKRLDTPYVVSQNAKKVGELYSLVSGIRMKVESNQPAVVVYTPPEFAAICFETQNYPDAPNIKSFPSALLHPGETYCNQAVFTFDLVT